jgi:hypothetical protein
MQDAKRIQEQVSEMAIRAETHLGTTQEHLRRTEEKRAGAEVELTKFRFLVDGLVTAEQMLAQRRGAIESAGQNAPASALSGVDGALEMMRDLQRQGRENAARCEGKFQVLRQLEDELRQEVIAATSRARGLVVQAPRAVEVAERRDQSPTSGEILSADPQEEVSSNTEDGTEGDASLAAMSPLLAVLDSVEPAKEPIAPRRKSAGKTSSPPQKPEH